MLTLFLGLYSDPLIYLMRLQFLAALASTVGLNKDQGSLPEKESGTAAPASEKLAQPLPKTPEVVVPGREDSSDKPSAEPGTAASATELAQDVVTEPGVAMPVLNPALDPSAQTSIPSSAEQV